MDARERMNRLGSRGIPFIFIIDFDMARPVVQPLAEIDPKEILYDINGVTNAPRRNAPVVDDLHSGMEKGPLIVSTRPIPYERYAAACEVVQDYERAGDSYLLNLTFPTRIELAVPLDSIFHLSGAKYRLRYRDEFVVFSPEPFVRIRDGSISSFPMKGTINAAIPDAERIIMADEKEFAEHLTIVDLIRNDLNMVARRVTVDRFRYIERVQARGRDLLHVSSEIRGELDQGYEGRIGDIIFTLLPAGSVTGAPKRRTVEIIKEVEGYDRGYYTGILGWSDGVRLDSGVMIRFIEKDGDSFVYKSGGGITVYSDPASEYRELLDKIYVPLA